MEIWTLIVKSNTFNFLILLGLIIFAIKFFKVGNLIESACTKVRETVEKSQNAKEDSKNELQKANEAVKNIAREVEEIFNNAQKSAELTGKKILDDADIEARGIFDNAQKTLESESKKTALSLTQKTALASYEIAKNHICKTIKEKPDYHKDFIEQSIKELDRLKTNE